MFGGGFDPGGLNELAEVASSEATQGTQPQGESLPPASGGEEQPVNSDGTPWEGDFDDDHMNGDSMMAELNKRMAKEEAMAAVARTIGSSCQHWNTKDNEFPKKNKPDSATLRAEVLRRDKEQRPGHWYVQKLCEWLRDHPAPPVSEGLNAGEEQELPQGRGQSARGGVPNGTDGGDVSQGADAGGADEVKKQRRWTKTAQTVRLVHCIVELKGAYLVRDQKPANRQELESVDRKWFWHELAKLFNTSTFSPPLITCPPDPDSASDFTGLSAGYDGFPADAKKLQEEFGNLRRILTVALHGFRKSGMGDFGPDGVHGWESSAQQAEHSNTVYSSKFKNFLHGDLVAEYAYNILLKHGLLESSTADMPTEAQHNGDSNRSCKTKRVRPKESNPRKKRLQQQMGSLQAVLSQPMQLLKSEEEKRKEHYAANTARLQYMGATETLMAQKEQALLPVECGHEHTHTHHTHSLSLSPTHTHTHTHHHTHTHTHTHTMHTHHRHTASTHIHTHHSTHIHSSRHTHTTHTCIAHTHTHTHTTHTHTHTTHTLTAYSHPLSRRWSAPSRNTLT